MIFKVCFISSYYCYAYSYKSSEAKSKRLGYGEEYAPAFIKPYAPVEPGEFLLFNN